MTIDQFRNNQMLSQQLADLLKNQILQTALAVCDQASPANGGIGKIAAEPHVAHIQLGVDRGYNLYPQVLRLLATPMPKEEEVAATYEPRKDE